MGAAVTAELIRASAEPPRATAERQAREAAADGLSEPDILDALTAETYDGLTEDDLGTIARQAVIWQDVRAELHEAPVAASPPTTVSLPVASRQPPVRSDHLRVVAPDQDAERRRQDAEFAESRLQDNQTKATLEVEAYQRGRALLDEGRGYWEAKLVLAAELAGRMTYGAEKLADTMLQKAKIDRDATAKGSGKPKDWWLLYNKSREYLGRDDCRLLPQDRLMLIALVDHWSARERCARPGLTRLGRLAGCGIKGARSSVRRLERAGLVVIEDRGPRAAHAYRFAIPSAGAGPPDQAANTEQADDDGPTDVD